MSEITCSLCGAPLVAQNIDRRLAVARCGHCNGLSDISNTPLMDSGRAEVPLPPRVQLEREGDSLRIVRTWFSWNRAVGLGLVLMFPVYFAVTGMPEMPEMPLPFAILFSALYLASVYTALAGVINKTGVTIEGTALKVRHWPLLWLPMPTIQSSDIEQIYCNERKVTTQNSDKSRRTTRIVYDVLAQVQGASKNLVRNLDTKEQAQFIEQEIERTLGIFDQAVGSEDLR